MEENKFLNILSKHWSKFLVGFLIFACIAAWGERLFRSNKAHAKKDFLAANQVKECFLKGEILSLEALQNMENVLKRHPELKPGCEVLLSYMFYSQKNIPKALLHAESTLARVKKDLSPPFVNFSETALLIVEKKYKEALDAAQKLQLEIKDQKEFEVLSGMNLLRILFLAESVNDVDLKKATWEKLQMHPSFKDISSLFKEGSFSLTDYFEKTKPK